MWKVADCMIKKNNNPENSNLEIHLGLLMQEIVNNYNHGLAYVIYQQTW